MSYGKELNDGLDLLISANAGAIKGDNLYYPEFNSDSTNHGIAQNLDGERYFGFFSTVAKNDFKLSAYYTSRRKDIPTASFGTVFNKLSYTNDANGFINLSYDHDASDVSEYMVRLFYSYYRYDGLYTYPEFNYSDQSIGHWFGSEFQFILDLASNNRFTSGFEITFNPTATYKSWSPSTFYFDGNFPYTTYSVYLQDDYKPFRNVSVILGFAANQYTGNQIHFIPRLAVIFKPTGTSSLKYLYGEAFRFPDAYENNYYDLTSNFIKTVSLSPEEIQTNELSKVIIGIVFQNSYRASVDAKETLVDIIDESGLKVENRIVNYILIDLSGSGGMEYFVKNSSPDVLFVLPIRGINFSSITAFSQRYKIMTFTGMPAYMNDGISTCVNMDGEKPVIIINRNSARSEGVDFSSQLLKVARIIE